MTYSMLNSLQSIIGQFLSATTTKKKFLFFSGFQIYVN